MKGRSTRWKGTPPVFSYDPVAATYDRRFSPGEQGGIAECLRTLVRDFPAGRVLEAGCGTGHWLAELGAGAGQVVGLDFSAGMLAQARSASPGSFLVRARAEAPPFQSQTFDLVVCVNALHHFSQPRDFIQQARRLLQTGGALAVIGMDPHAGRDDWFVYQYFPGTYQTDLDRYPSTGDIQAMMAQAGLDPQTAKTVEHIRAIRTGREILEDPMLEKNSTSQLILLSDEEYARGVSRIKAEVLRAEAAGTDVFFPADITLYLVAGVNLGELEKS